MSTHSTPKRRLFRRGRLLAGAAAVFALALLSVEDLRSALPMPTGFAGLSPVNDSELADMRGGFMLPNGMVLNFQLRFRTLVNHSHRGGGNNSITTTTNSNTGFTVTTTTGGGPPMPGTADFAETWNFDETSFEPGDTGVINSVVVTPGSEPGDPPNISVEVVPTDAIAGVLNVVQNNVPGVIIQTQGSLGINLTNGPDPLAGMQANNLAFRLRSLSLFGF